MWFEDGFAVGETEDLERVNMPRALLPPGAREGGVLHIELEGRKTMKRRDDTSALIGELWKD